MSDLKQLSTDLNSELELLLNNSQQTDAVIQCLRDYFRYSLLRHWIKRTLCCVVIVGVLCSSIYYIPLLNWNASAIGRLALIKLVLPFYHWQYLYNSRCLIKTIPLEEPTVSVSDGNYGGFRDDDCAVCENLGN